LEQEQRQREEELNCQSVASQLSMVEINRNHFAQSFSSCGRKSCCRTWEMDELPALNCIASCFEKKSDSKIHEKVWVGKVTLLFNLFQ